MPSGDDHARALHALARRGRRRALERRRGLDFASNDTLGLAHASALREAMALALARGIPVGAGGSRLLRGNHGEHEALEREAAAFFGSQSALFMGGGFSANLALFSTLPRRGDLVVFDRAIHASVHDGMTLSHALARPARHNDAGEVEAVIGRWRADGGLGRPWIAVESLYSMDGDRAPLDDLSDVARRCDAILVIDEAHATGVLGERGRGLAAHLEGRNDVITVHTCGKALGLEGALICGPKVFVDYLVNRARPFIYATAPSPLIAAGVRASLVLVAAADDRRARLRERVTTAGHALAGHLDITPSGTHIQPVIVGADRAASALATALQAAGYDVRAVRPPTVPEGTSRLRIALTLNVSTDETLALIAAMGHAIAQLGITVTNASPP